MGSVVSQPANNDNKLDRDRACRVPMQKLPMPSHEEVEARFLNVLASMDLPPDKVRLLKSYDDERKWELLCDQERFSAKEPPEYYLEKLKIFLDNSTHKNTKTIKKLGCGGSTQLLRNLEISLRTNPIGWVRLFLSEEHRGLDILVSYLSATLNNVRAEQKQEGNGTLPLSPSSEHPSADAAQRSRQSVRYALCKQPKPSGGFATDDVHVCIMCLRAIMNHQYGFNLVFGHEQAINCIALSLTHRNYRTKTLVLELLAAVCLVSGGHQMILLAFDNFKKVCGEMSRFETLMYYFQHYEEFHNDFMVACMQFINIIVHSVENMNFRVHLQHEFTILGLDDYLQKLRHTDSERLPIQVNAYLDNMIEVQTLLEESDLKTIALEKVAELEEELSHTIDKLNEQEDNACSKINELQQQIEALLEEKSKYEVICEQQKEQIKRLSTHGSSNAKVTPATPTSTPSEKGDALPAIPVPPAPPAPPIPPPGLPPVPPPGFPPMFGAPPPPPLGMPAPGAVAIKKAIQPIHRLPVLNWVSMKPNEVKGTMFNELDDEKLYKELDFNEFEDLFKLGNITLMDVDIDSVSTIRLKKKPEKMSLLDPNRMRNVAITRRKIEMKDDEIVKSINSMDLQKLTLERVEILMRVIPNEQEVKAFKEFEKEKKNLDSLADEDRFMINLSKIERIQQKLAIMCYIGNFFDTVHHLQPQLQAVSDASASIYDSRKIRKLFEIILAFGNYMNSSKRGAVYGFKIQSLDMLNDTKSNDKKLSLLHYIVKTIKRKFPEVFNFDHDIRHLEKAATVSLDNVLSDIGELEKGLELTKREYEARRDRDIPILLKDFVSNADDKVKKLKSDAKHAQESYGKVVQHFGENIRTISPNSFFSLFLRFIKSFKQADSDLENMLRLEEAQKTIKASVRENKKDKKKFVQETVVSELKQKQQRIKEKKVLNRDEICHGTLEDILLDLKSEPYRRADAVRRSLRKRNDMKPAPVQNLLM